MKNKILKIKTVLVILFALLLTNCTEKELFDNSTKGSDVKFIVDKIDGNISSRSPEFRKESFVSGDIIHVEAAFKIIGAGDTPEYQYACMKFDGEDWNVADKGTPLTWPSNAESGTFKAYYLPGTENRLTDNGKAETTSLSEYSGRVINTLYRDDPMEASYTNAVVGSAVHLQFTHLCTKLTFTNLQTDKNVDENELMYIVGASKDTLAYTLSSNKLTVELLGHTEALKNMVSNKVEGVQTGEQSLTYLLPEIPANTKLMILRKDYSVYHVFETPEAFLPGVHYSIDIKKLKDNYISDAIKQEPWSPDGAVDLDSQEFGTYLRSIRDGKAFKKTIGGQDVQILIETTEGGKKVVAQICDVNFVDVQGKVFEPVNIADGIIFQGNNHTITGVPVTNIVDENKTGNDEPNSTGEKCLALFGVNNGVIKNIKINGISSISSNKNVRYAGTLVAYNRGTIENVSITFSSEYNSMNVTSSSELLYIGALAGYNTGIINGVTINGDFALNTGSNNGVRVGGFVGFNSGEIKNSKVQTESSGTITTTSVGTIRAGGFCGYASSDSKIENTSTNVFITSIDNGNDLIAGGFAGYASGSIDLSSCSGTLSLGMNVGSVGGFVGSAENANLNRCSTSSNISSVTGSSAIGGFVGTMIFSGESSCVIKNSYTLSSLPNSDTNAFVGKGYIESNIENIPLTNRLFVYNSFAKNIGAKLGNSDDATITNCHLNGNPNVSTLNQGRTGHADWLEWLDSPAIYGNGIPYFKF